MYSGNLRALTIFTFFSLVFSHAGSGQTFLDPGHAIGPVVSAGKHFQQVLSDRGISPGATMIYDWSKSIDGQDSGTGFGRQLLDAGLAFDGKKLWGITGSAGMVRLRSHGESFGDDWAHEEQIVSNIDASPRTTLYEAWIEQRLLADKLRLKAGKIDANTEFAVVTTASDFLNSSMGYSPTIVAFPSYPEPKPGFNAFVHTTATSAFGWGMFETTTGGTLMIFEPSKTWHVGQTEKQGRISGGYWRLGGNVARFGGGTSAGTQGFYSVLEQVIWRNSDTRCVSTFFQFGAADGQVSPFERHFSAGAVLQGLFRRRLHDSIGIAGTWVRSSSAPDKDLDAPSELIFESYYKVALSSHLSLVQDFQFIHHPDGLRSYPDCPILTPRLVASF